MIELEKAARQALGALENSTIAVTMAKIDERNAAITAMRQAIEQAEKQDPVAWMHKQGNYKEPSLWQLGDDEIERGWEQYPLYTTPQKREWVELTDEEIIRRKADIKGTLDVQFIDFARAILAKAKEKNT